MHWLLVTSTFENDETRDSLTYGRHDLRETTSYKQLSFLQHIVTMGPLKLDVLRDFVTCYKAKNRHERIETFRFKYNRCEVLIFRDKAGMDLYRLKDGSLDNLDDFPLPDVLQQEIIDHLEAALSSFGEVGSLRQVSSARIEG
ncbi:hypothetical protein [Propionivibrio sp.]|uniref:hypothetical protein n=1 Tax=Propionivibrio sp. TaxID=2212460 RepID=UPI003BF19870